MVKLKLRDVNEKNGRRDLKVGYYMIVVVLRSYQVLIRMSYRVSYFYFENNYPVIVFDTKYKVSYVMESNQ